MCLHPVISAPVPALREPVWEVLLEECAPFSFLIRSILFCLRHLRAQQTPTCCHNHQLRSSLECFSWAGKSVAKFTEDETL